LTGTNSDGYAPGRRRTAFVLTGPGLQNSFRGQMPEKKSTFQATVLRIKRNIDGQGYWGPSSPVLLRAGNSKTALSGVHRPGTTRRKVFIDEGATPLGQLQLDRMPVFLTSPGRKRQETSGHPGPLQVSLRWMEAQILHPGTGQLEEDGHRYGQTPKQCRRFEIVLLIGLREELFRQASAACAASADPEAGAGRAGFSTFMPTCGGIATFLASMSTRFCAILGQFDIPRGD